MLQLSEQDVALSFLPLSHSFERTVSYIYLLSGVTMVFAESFDTIGRDIAHGAADAVHRRAARVREAPRPHHGEGPGGAGAQRLDLQLGGRRRRRARRARRSAAGRSGFSARCRRRSPTAWSSPRSARVSAAASATWCPAARRCRSSIAEFFQGIGLPIIEGYGLTETSPILTVNPPDAPRAGTVGRAIPGVELRIAEDGEILARGPNIMSGYYNKPEATAEALKDGWFHTGDIGAIDEDGYLRITDRKKDLLVTSGGKKIAPQPIEAVIKRNPLVAEAVLLGDRRKFAAALIVPSFPALERRLKDLGRPPAPRAELVTRADVLALYQEIVDALNRDLSQFERIKKIALLPAEFSIESGELTPTLKVKRKVVEERWREAIEALYEF